MNDIYILVCSGIVAVLTILIILVIIFAIVSMIIASCSDNPPRKHFTGSFHKHRDYSLNDSYDYISQKRVPGGV